MKINGKPDGGGGGVITGLSVTSNGTYIAGAGVDGYSPVKVDVQPSLQSKSTSENGTITPDDGYYGLSAVNVNVQPLLQDKTISVNGSYTAEQGYYGFSTVTVNVPEQKPEETFSVTPSIAEQTITPHEGYVFNGGTVAAVTSTIDENIQTGNIKSGVTILGVTGTYTAPTPVTESLSVSLNGTYYPTQGVDGFSQVVVDVPQSVTGYTEKDVTEGIQIVNLNNSASTVHPYVFEKDSYLQTVNLPNCTFVGIEAFAQCANLTTVSLPVCERIDSYAFRNSPGINIYAPECSSIQYGAFANCNYLYSVSFPKCTYIAQDTFSYCYWLSEVYLPKCTYIGINAFNYCVRLQSVNLEKCLEIGQTAFGGVSSSLSSLNLPVISKLGGQAFMNCSMLSQLTLCTGTYTIPSYNNIFQNTPFNQGIGSIYVDATLYDTFISSTGWINFASLFVSVGTSDPMLSFSDGLLYGKTTNIYSNWKDYVGTTSSLLTKVSLSECDILNVQTFMNCINLSEVDLPKCQTITMSAFQSCAALTSINIPEVVSIAYKAFFSCNNLEEIDLHSCEYIGENAFYWLQKLSKVTFRGSTVCGLYDSKVFSQYRQQTPLVSFFVPASLVDAYKADPIWSWYSSRIFPIE